jgi:hypothetical protein
MSAYCCIKLDLLIDTEDGKVVSRTHRPPLTLENIPGTHFCYRPSQPQGHSAAGRIMSTKNSNDTIGNRKRDLPACSAVPQPTAPPRAPNSLVTPSVLSSIRWRDRVHFALDSWQSSFRSGFVWSSCDLINYLLTSVHKVSANSAQPKQYNNEL